ncbi:Titin, partial [Fasciola hepatica]
TAAEQKILELECEIEADLKPVEVVWTLNDQELVQSDRVEILYIEDIGVARLTIHDVAPTDSGDYACVVTGRVIEATTGEEVTKSIKSVTHVAIKGKLSY